MNQPANSYPILSGYKVVEKYVIPQWVYDMKLPGTAGLYTEIVPGMSANQVLEILPKIIGLEVKVLGQDGDGYVVEWHYPDVVFTLAYAETEYESAYVVQQIQVKDDN